MPAWGTPEKALREVRLSWEGCLMTSRLASATLSCMWNTPESRGLASYGSSDNSSLEFPISLTAHPINIPAEDLRWGLHVNVPSWPFRVLQPLTVPAL